MHKNELYQNSRSIKWEDENKEIVILGESYDIAEVKCSGDHAVLRIMKDEKEKELKKSYAKLYQNSENRKEVPLSKLLKQLLQWKYLPADLIMFDHFDSQEKDLLAFHVNYPQGHLSSVFIPPAF